MKLHKGDFIVRKRVIQTDGNFSAWYKGRAGEVRYEEERMHGYVGCTDDGQVSYGLTRIGTVWHIFELTTGFRLSTAPKKDDAVQKCEELKDNVIKALTKIKEEYRRLNK